LIFTLYLVTIQSQIKVLKTQFNLAIFQARFSFILVLQEVGILASGIMNELEKELAKFDSNLYDKSELVEVKLNRLSPDSIMSAMTKNANPFSAVRTAKETYEQTSPFLNLLSLHSPIICYQARGYYYVVSGFFTFLAFQRYAAQYQTASERIIRVFLLGKTPPKSLRRSIILHSLSTDLLSKCFIADTKKISFYLRTWFNHDPGKRSIFQSQEWLSLFPNLNSIEKVAEYLSVSKTELSRSSD